MYSRSPFSWPLVILLSVCTLQFGCRDGSVGAPPRNAAYAGGTHDHGSGGHGDHDHGDGHAHDDHGSAELEPVTITKHTDAFTVFAEFPRLIVGQPADFLVHLTVRADGSAFHTGTMQATVTDRFGGESMYVLEKPKRDGLFVPTITFRVAGQYQLELDITGAQASEVIELGNLTVYEDLNAAKEAADKEHAEDDDAISFLMEQQWLIGLQVEQATQREMREGMRVVGRLDTPHHAQGEVAVSETGRLDAPDGGQLPRLGQRVEAGQLLGYVEPPLPLLSEVALRSVDLEIQGLEIDRDIRSATARLAFAEAEQQRMTGLMDRKVAANQEINATKRDLEVARADYEAALEMRRRFDAAARDLTELRQLIIPADGDDDGADIRASHRVALTAPISGVVTMADAVAGQNTVVGDVLFRITDPKVMWLRAEVPEIDVPRLPATPNALFSLSGANGNTFDVRALGGDVVFMGVEVDERTRTLPIVFSVPNPDGVLRGGMRANVFIQTDATRQAITVPKSAIVKEAGRPLVFVMTNGESFERRSVRLGARNGQFVEVLSGINAGDWVVSHGAYLLKLAAAAPSSFGHGHAH